MLLGQQVAGECVVNDNVSLLSSSSSAIEKKTILISSNSIKIKEIIDIAQWNTNIILDMEWLNNQKKQENQQQTVKEENKLHQDVKCLSSVETRAVILLRLISSLTLITTSVSSFLVSFCFFLFFLLIHWFCNIG